MQAQPAMPDAALQELQLMAGETLSACPEIWPCLFSQGSCWRATHCFERSLQAQSALPEEALQELQLMAGESL